MERYDKIIIGDGIAARSLLWHLGHRKEEQRILQIFSPKLAPDCSLKTTSIVSLFGMQKGVSPLGDTLVDAYRYTEKLFLEHNPAGVVKAPHYQIWDAENAQFEQRFGAPEACDLPNGKYAEGVINESYLLDSSRLLNWLDEQTFLEREKKEGLVLSLDSGQVELMGGEKVSASQVFLCTGAGTAYFFPKLAPKSKVVPGCYMTFPQYSGGKESWVLSRRGHNLIYRAWSQELVLGATSQTDEVLLARRDQLREIYRLFENDCQLPAFEQGIIATGMRQKGRKRQPFFGEIEPNLYGLHSLYKNGFTMAFYGAKKLLEEIN